MSNRRAIPSDDSATIEEATRQQEEFDRLTIMSSIIESDFEFHTTDMEFSIQLYDFLTICVFDVEFVEAQNDESMFFKDEHRWRSFWDAG